MSQPEISDELLAAMHGYAATTNDIAMLYATAEGLGLFPRCTCRSVECDCLGGTAAERRAAARVSCAARWEMMTIIGCAARVWTTEQIAERRLAGDALVTAPGWCMSTSTLSGAGTARLHMDHTAPGGPVVADPRDGFEFSSKAAAECYALNRGALRWYRTMPRQESK